MFGTRVMIYGIFLYLGHDIIYYAQWCMLIFISSISIQEDHAQVWNKLGCDAHRTLENTSWTRELYAAS